MTTIATPAPNLSKIHAYIELCKPNVVLLMLLTAFVGMCLATPTFVAWKPLCFGLLGIAFTASGAAVINHLIDRRIDALMHRTQSRPIPMQSISPANAFAFACALTTVGMLVLLTWVNTLTAVLSFLSLLGYAVIYTIFLKHATPQNIVIGGAAGAMPPLLGWTSVTGHIDPHSLLLVLIIFVWTPPHFWALAIYRVKDYANAKIPMLPVTHGIPFTKLNILLYTFLLIPCTILPYVVGMSGWIYFVGILLLNLRFVYWCVRLACNQNKIIAFKTFKFSIYYLMILFILLLVDHYCGTYY